MRTTAPVSESRVRVMPCAPPAEAMVPWLRIDTAKLTAMPALGVPGDQVTAPATRSELATGLTVSEPVRLLFDSSCSMTVFASSTVAVTS